MSGLTGMDIAQVRNLARAMNAEAESIVAMAHRLSGRIESAPWVGNDKDRFVEGWRSHAAALIRVADALRAAAKSASAHADMQEWASNQA
jgi:hypothetical protein